MNKLKARKIYLSLKKLKIQQLAYHHTLCSKKVSSPIAKRNIIFGKVETTFFLIIDNIIMEYIKKYTEAKALQILRTKLILPIPKLYAFIAILCILGAYQTKNLPISYL
ncbi:hypothetical protein HZH68_017107 [Vespula germanica]|uniref:Uncharacterized protein n=1 Tax=Vespula germanica TaxID=30212 RepID=A0A834MMR9_VESGE|nr:hypothetical protein HZH68_017107 [Vespula germanica]